MIDGLGGFDRVADAIDARYALHVSDMAIWAPTSTKEEATRVAEPQRVETDMLLWPID